jgi:hypothetical protein
MKINFTKSKLDTNRAVEIKIKINPIFIERSKNKIDFDLVKNQN